MKLRPVFLLLVALQLFGLHASLAHADGAVIPPPNYKVYESGQQAVVWFENNLETLIVTARVLTNAADFGWLIPTPTRPIVDKASYEIFTALNELTQPPLVATYEERIPLFNMGFESKAPPPVRVLEEKTIGIYQVVVLEANDAQALESWLMENGYPYPRQGAYILEDYIQNGWYFTAARINEKSALSSTYLERWLQPLQLRFATEKMVYPFKISAIQVDDFLYDDDLYQNVEPSFSEEQLRPDQRSTPAIINDPASIYLPNQWGSDVKPDIYPYPPGPSKPSQQDVTLYIFDTQHKKTLPGFTTLYAGWIKPEKIQQLAMDEQGNHWIETASRMYLTKLSRSLNWQEIDYDLYPRDADDNKSVNAPEGVDLKLFFLIGVVFLVVSAEIWLLSKFWPKSKLEAGQKDHRESKL